jgi:hypothetical protein
MRGSSNQQEYKSSSKWWMPGIVTAHEANRRDGPRFGSLIWVSGHSICAAPHRNRSNFRRAMPLMV